MTPHGKIRPEEEWIVVEDNHQGIISEDQYDRCNAIMDSNAHARGVSRTSHIHVFRQLIRCGKCDKNFISTVDRPRADGYRPSAYRCYNYVHSKKDYRKCSGAIGEVKLGPFVINYISNLLRANDYVRSKGTEASETEIEMILLSGKYFKDVVGVHPKDLKETYNVIMRNTGDLLFDPKEDIEVDQDLKLNDLKENKKKLERAITRLEDLYLFSEESMSEKDFLIKKQDISKKIEKINSDIRERSIEFSRSAPGHDLSFIKKATQYLLGHDLLSSKDINYNEIVKLIDKKLLQDFMQTVIKKITVEEDKSISSIEFANVITHRFIYDS